MRAYRLADVQRYAGRGQSSAVCRSLAPDAIVYLRGDLRVVSGCFGPDLVLFESEDPKWTRFCQDELDFRVPDWEAESICLRESAGVA
jgi:hypothetical protein